jgi:tRNA-dihydrouridine synthase 3
VSRWKPPLSLSFPRAWPIVLVSTLTTLCVCVLDFLPRSQTRIGWFDNQPVAHTFFPRLREWGAAACTLHGRTRAQRYTRLADWEYIKQCVEVVDDAIPVVGNGDIFSYRGACELCGVMTVSAPPPSRFAPIARI